jgi:Arc/MetJ-type ribon-helix-helix transcriptional regulator
MATTISLQNEQLLNQVVASGRFQNQDEALSEALRLLYEQTRQNGSEQSLLPPEKWIKEFDRITASRHSGNPLMDDSRESIYDDHGA